MFSVLLKGFFWLKTASKDFFVYGNTVIATILLTVVYLTAVALTAIVARIFGKHFLDTNVISTSKSYWTDFEPVENIKRNIYRQF